MNGKSVIIFCSNNYLGLANHPELKRAGIEAIEKYGTSSVASRLISGNMTLHEELEEKIAQFKGTESALLFNSGYHANTGVIPALVTRGDLILSDALNHASIIDGCRLSKAETVIYPHSDLNYAESVLKTSRHKRKLIVTDGVFSMDGDIAPLKDLTFLRQKYNALLMVDEAHAIGVIGRNGRGITAHLNVTESVDIMMGTLGKALGSYGAFVATTKVMRDYLINRARSLIFSTSLPPHVCAISLRAIELLESSPSLIEKLHENVRFVKERLKPLFSNIPDNPVPIIPLIVGDDCLTMSISEKLLAEGIFVQGIRPPTVPPGTSRLRATIMATHSIKHLKRFISSIYRICEPLLPARKIHAVE
jgi:8-amino-7-oxononanoate synthase